MDDLVTIVVAHPRAAGYLALALGLLWLASEVLAYLGKVRANGVVQLVFGVLARVFGRVPIVGVVVRALGPLPPPAPAEDLSKRRVIDRASLRALLPLVFLAALLAGCDWSPIDDARSEVLYGLVVGGLAFTGAAWWLFRYAGARRIVLVALLALPACAAPWRAAAIGISTVDRAAAKALQEWEAHDVAHEAALVDEAIAKNRPAETVKKEVAAWRAIADRVDAGFVALAAASGAAKAGVVMAAQGKASIAGVLSALLEGVRAFLGVLRVAGVKLPAELAGLVGAS